MGEGPAGGRRAKIVGDEGWLWSKYTAGKDENFITLILYH
jgi:hypothetical protein